MQRFRSNGTGKFLDSVLPELLNQLDQSVEKWTSETADYEKPWNYFLRIASILWRKSLVAPMTVHLDLTSRCNTKCSFCGYHSPLIKESMGPFWLANLRSRFSNIQKLTARFDQIWGSR